MASQSRHAPSSALSGAASSALFVVGGMLAAAVVLALGFVLFQGFVGDRIVPGVRVGIVDIGGKTTQEAQAALEQSFEAQLRRPLRIQASNGTAWQATPAELGFGLSTDATLQRALQVGHQDDLLDRVRDQVAAWRGDVVLTPVVSLDPNTFAEASRALGTSLEAPFVDATVSFRDGRVSVIPPQAGLRLDTQSLQDQVLQRLTWASAEPVMLELTRSEPTRSQEAVQPLARQVETIIASPLVLDIPGSASKITVPTRDLAAMVQIIDSGEGGPGALQVRLDPARVQALQDRVSRQIDQTPQNARMQYVGPNNLRVITEGRDGIALNAEAFPQFLLQAASAAERSAVLPVQVTRPYTAAASAEAMGIKEVIYQQSTSYAGGTPERNHNVELGARLLNGVIIPPRSVFSFNDTVGAVSAERGFKMGFSIIENETVPDAGGGICQVSTTVFQAAFLAGYPIRERWAHAYDVTRYHAPHPGMDATIYTGQLDMKFENPFDTAMLVQATAVNGRMTVTLYGTKPGWNVKIGSPVITNRTPADPNIIRQESPDLAKGRQYWVEQASEGKTVTITRTVEEAGKEPRTLNLISNFRAQRNVLLIGTGGEPAGPTVITDAQGRVLSTPTPGAGATPTAAAKPQATGTPTAAPKPQATATAAPKPQATATPSR